MVGREVRCSRATCAQHADSGIARFTHVSRITLSTWGGPGPEPSAGRPGSRSTALGTTWTGTSEPLVRTGSAARSLTARPGHRPVPHPPQVAGQLGQWTDVGPQRVDGHHGRHARAARRGGRGRARTARRSRRGRGRRPGRLAHPVPRSAVVRRIDARRRPPGRAGDDRDLVAGGSLPCGQVADVQLDAADARQVAVGDVQDPHAATPLRARSSRRAAGRRPGSRDRRSAPGRAGRRPRRRPRRRRGRASARRPGRPRQTPSPPGVSPTSVASRSAQNASSTTRSGTPAPVTVQARHQQREEQRV